MTRWPCGAVMVASITGLAGMRRGGGDCREATVRRVRASDYRHAEPELARGIGRDWSHAGDLGVTQDGRKPILGERTNEVDHGGGARERDHVDAVTLQEANQGRPRVRRADGSVDGKDLDLGTSVGKQRW